MEQDAQARPALTPEIDALLEDYEEPRPRKPSSFFDLRWFILNVATFCIVIGLIVGISAAAGAWKGGGGSGGSSPLPGATVFGRWDSFEYEHLEALKAEGAPQGLAPAPGVGSEALKPAPGGEHAFVDTAGAVELESLELKGKCGFESFEPVGIPQGIRLIEGPMSQFGSLYKLQKAAGMSVNEGMLLQKAMEKLVDMKGMRAEDRVRLFVKEDSGAFWFMEYRRSETTIYHFLKTGEGVIDAHEVVFPTRKEWAKAGGEVHGSLYKAVEEQGLEGSIVNFFAEALGAYIDFSEDTRDGDVFKVIASSEWIGKKFMGYDPPQAIYYKGSKAGEITAILFPPDTEEPVYYKPDGLALKKLLAEVPLKTLRVTSGFNLTRMHPILKVIKPHMGTDFGAPTGTPVFAYADGTVVAAQASGAMGNMVRIDHGGGIESYYGHLHAYAKGIKAGVAVKRAQLIAYVGSTGRSTGPHLHFGLKRDGKFVDPMKFLSVRETKETPIEASLAESFTKRAKTLLAILNVIQTEREEEEEEPAAAAEPSAQPAQHPAKPQKAPAKKADNLGWDEEW
jgi:murein DD-endopeptidase MepM/ murein hydrolase activator NlpD